MTPIHNKHCNTILKRPEGMSEEQCSDLPVYRTPGSENDPPTVSSFWKPTQEELIALAKGGCIMLTVQGTTHPPVALNTIWE